jgi:hypothetical protein
LSITSVNPIKGLKKITIQFGNKVEEIEGKMICEKIFIYQEQYKSIIRKIYEEVVENKIERLISIIQTELRVNGIYLIEDLHAQLVNFLKSYAWTSKELLISLRELLQDGEWRVRETAAESLEKLAQNTLLLWKTVREISHDENGYVR